MAMASGKEIIQTWPEDQRETTQVIIDTYGELDEATPGTQIWHSKGQWKKIVASKEGTPHDFPFPLLDIVESITTYRVPPEKFSELGEFDGSVTVRRTQGLISARCHDEQANSLALNLARDIVQGEKTAGEARAYYVDEMVRYRAKQPTPYMDRLQFAPQSDAGDRDVTLISPEELKKRADQEKAA
jgi:hypothetical protein